VCVLVSLPHSFLSERRTEPSACGDTELGLGTADGLIEIDFRGNMFTGSLPARLASLPIVVRALRICLSHF